MNNRTQDGVFSQEPILDLSTKRLQKLILNSDLASMIKVREEGLNYKYKKEKTNIQKLLSSQKISPRTGSIREIELEKWVDKERREIDQTKRIYHENRKITEENKKKIEQIISETQITQDQLKKIIADKVTTPREGQSFRSGFNSSRKLYELSQINKHISSENLDDEHVDNRIKIDNDLSNDSIIDNQNDKSMLTSHEESKEKSIRKEPNFYKYKEESKYDNIIQERDYADISDEFEAFHNKGKHH